ncbi:hypothetical protein CsSME_00032763 [Camellia sinensis var. sinensis]
MNRRRLEAPPNDEPYFVSPHLYFENPPPSSSKLSLTQISHSLALSRFFFRAIAISKFLRPNLSATVWLQSRSFSERLQFRSSILSTAVYNLRKTNRILQNLLQLRDFEVRFGTLHLFNQRSIAEKHYTFGAELSRKNEIPASRSGAHSLPKSNKNNVLSTSHSKHNQIGQTEMRVLHQTTDDDHLVLELGMNFRTADDMSAILVVKLSMNIRGPLTFLCWGFPTATQIYLI